MGFRNGLLGLLTVLGVGLSLAPIVMLLEPWYSAELRAIESDLLGLPGVRRVLVAGNKDVTIEDIRATLVLEHDRILSFCQLRNNAIFDATQPAKELFLSRIGDWQFRVDIVSPSGESRANSIDLSYSDPSSDLSFGLYSVESAVKHYDEILKRVRKAAESGKPIVHTTTSNVQYFVTVTPVNKASGGRKGDTLPFTDDRCHH